MREFAVIDKVTTTIEESFWTWTKVDKRCQDFLQYEVVKVSNSESYGVGILL